MSLILLILMGAAVGWAASPVLRGQDARGAVADAAVGVTGALFAGYVLGPSAGLGQLHVGQFSMAHLGLAQLGAIILLALTSALRHVMHA
jgi:uncharacterized membrane protein YeaQ/YmgE (transglycosylase-associated protein family)